MGKVIVFIIIALLALGVVCYLIGLYKRIIALRSQVEQSFSDVDELLKQRADEIPELVSLLETSAGFQSQLFQQLTKLRKRYLTSRKSEEKIRLANQIEQGIGQVFTLAKAYPELKSLYGFVELQKRLIKLDDKIATHRQFFNQSAMRYNAGIETFPNAVLAFLMGYRTKSLLTVATGEENEDNFII